VRAEIIFQVACSTLLCIGPSSNSARVRISQLVLSCVLLRPETWPMSSMSRCSNILAASLSNRAAT
jgi:hypothetical protein